MSTLLLGEVAGMNYASEIINHVTKKAQRRLILVIVLTAALIASNLVWGYAYAKKSPQTVAYVTQNDSFIQAQNIKRKGVPRKVSGHEKM